MSTDYGFWWLLAAQSNEAKAKEQIAAATSSEVARTPVEELKYFIQQVQAGRTGSFPTPSSYMRAPTSPREGWEQAAWIAAQAANQTGGANAYSNMAQEYYSISLGKSSSLSVPIEAKQEGLLAVLKLIEPDPALVALTSTVRRRIDPTLIVESTADEEDRRKSDLWEGAKGTAWDVGIFLQGVGGLFTGKTPMGVNPTKYKMIRYGIYGFVTLSVSAYALGQVRAITDALKKDEDDED